MYIVEATIGIPTATVCAGRARRISMLPSRTWARSWNASSTVTRKTHRPPCRRQGSPNRRSRRLTRFTTIKQKAGYPAFCILPCRHPQPAQPGIHPLRKLIEQRQHHQRSLPGVSAHRAGLPSLATQCRGCRTLRDPARAFGSPVARGAQRQPESHIRHAPALLQTLVEAGGIALPPRLVGTPGHQTETGAPIHLTRRRLGRGIKPGLLFHCIRSAAPDAA